MENITSDMILLLSSYSMLGQESSIQKRKNVQVKLKYFELLKRKVKSYNNQKQEELKDLKKN
jgi:hypothetical protein